MVCERQVRVDSSNIHDQAVGWWNCANNVYNYNGESQTQRFRLDPIGFIGMQSVKPSATWKGWHRESKSYIDDAELTIQRRDVAGWQFNLDHREYIQSAVLDLSLGYKRGTGAFDSLPAVEEALNEGTSRMKIWTLIQSECSVPI